MTALELHYISFPDHRSTQTTRFKAFCPGVIAMFPLRTDATSECLHTLGNAERCLKVHAGEKNECPDLKPALIPPIRSMYKNISCIWPKMRSSLARVWMVDLLVAVRVLPLQFASLLILTLPLTLPRLLALQLANPASVVEGAAQGPQPHKLCRCSS